MSDLIVTTPLTERAAAAEEAQDCQEAGGGTYFRRLGSQAASVRPGDRVYYVEAGFVRGYAVVSRTSYYTRARRCATTGRQWPAGWYVEMDAASWRWLTPLPLRGFQGWRYAPPEWRELPEVGGWRDPRPETEGTLCL